VIAYATVAVFLIPVAFVFGFWAGARYRAYSHSRPTTPTPPLPPPSKTRVLKVKKAVRK